MKCAEVNVKEGDIVCNVASGKVGVIVPTIRELRSDGPWSVIYWGQSVGYVVEEGEEFEIVGRYEAVPDEKGCGMGKGADACRFLGMAPTGLTCLRFGSLHWAMFFKSGLKAQRTPTKPFPDCKRTE